MKKTLLLIGLNLLIVLSVFSQDQTINGHLNVTGEIRSGQIVLGKHTTVHGVGTRLLFQGTSGNTDGIYMSKFTRGEDLSDLRVNIGDNIHGDDRFVIGTSPNNVWTEKFIFLNNGRLGINGISPTCALDVNGAALASEIIIGRRVSESSGKMKRITIPPYKHAGQWEIFARDTEANAYLDIEYSGRKNWTFKHTGHIGILTNEPLYPLDVAGDIRATNLHVAGKVNAREVKIEIAAGADFVFEPDYQLKPLSELEIFVKKNKHLPEIQSEKEMKDEGLNVNEMQIRLLQKVEELTLYIIEQDKKIKEQEQRINRLENQQIK